MSSSDANTSRTGWFRLWGPASGLGLAVAALSYVADQAHKYWMLEVYRIAGRGRVEITSFFDLVMAWTKGVSYGLFAQHDSAGRAVLIAVAVAAVTGLVIWMANAMTRLAALSLGLIVGGALGNLTDRIVHGAVADFFHFHYAGFSWYVFNIADVAIVAGVIGLLLDWLRSPAEAQR
jgi:signal peptidase II